MNLFPDVPMVPGVPALLRSAQPVLDSLGNLSHVVNIAESLINGPVDETWGVFDSTGADVMMPDTVLSVDYRNGSRLVDYPLEDGAFETYNKVANPYDLVVAMAKGGTQADRSEFLVACEALQASIDLYTVVVPEGSYHSVNLERFDYRRETRNGSHLIVVNLYFREIRVTAGVNGTVPQQPDGFEPKAAGQVTPNPITAMQQQLMSGAARGLAAVKSTVSGVLGNAKAALIGVLP